MPKLYEKVEKLLANGNKNSIHYATAVGAVALACGIKWIGGPEIFHGYGFILYYPAVFVVAMLGGLGPGLLAIVLSAGLAHFTQTPLLNGTTPSAAGEAASMIVFIICCTGICFLVDIMHHVVAKSRKLHAELYEQKEWLRTTLTSIGDAVIVTDSNGQVNFMNGEAERLTGWRVEDARKQTLRSVFRIVNEESRKSVDDPVEKVFRENRVVGLANHTLLLSKAGVEWPIEDSASPIYDEKKNIVGVVLVFHDATELRRNQRALKERADELEHKVFERTVSLQRTVNDLESFSYTVSHDLRSPLRAMLGYSQALVEDFPDMPAEAVDYLQKIGKSATRLDRLIQDLLAFSRLSHEDDNISSIDLDRLVHDILQQYPNFSGENASITIEGKLPTVLGHETALTQVISNLIGNAVKFVPAGRRPEVRVYVEGRERDIRLWVADNGIGIAPENQERIFKMFEQINPAGQYTGTGIGLAVVRKAVERMHGSIGVESKLGEGSKFWIELLKPKHV